MSYKTEELSIDVLERVLMRLGLSDRPAPTLNGLQTLYAAWCRKVPFDNVRKLIHVHNHDPGPLPGDDATDFLEAWLTYGTGGTCWAGNGALYAVLVSLGFHASRGMGTMLVAPNVPPNHGTVLVTCDETRYVVDASILHSAPLRLDASVPTGVTHPSWGVQCGRRDGHWYIRWRPVHMPDGLDCRVDHLHVTRETFRERHEQTRPWSPFNYELYARLLCGDAVVGTTGGQRVELNAAGGVVHKRLAGDDRIRLLVDELGMQEAIVHRLPRVIRRRPRRHGPGLHRAVLHPDPRPATHLDAGLSHGYDNAPGPAWTLAYGGQRTLGERAWTRRVLQTSSDYTNVIHTRTVSGTQSRIFCWPIRCVAILR